MLCALTKPLFDAATDFGEIEPVMVLTNTRLFDEERSWLTAGLINPDIMEKIRALRMVKTF